MNVCFRKRAVFGPVYNVTHGWQTRWWTRGRGRGEEEEEEEVGVCVCVWEAGYLVICLLFALATHMDDFDIKAMPMRQAGFKMLNTC